MRRRMALGFAAVLLTACAQDATVPTAPKASTAPAAGRSLDVAAPAIADRGGSAAGGDAGRPAERPASGVAVLRLLGRLPKGLELSADQATKVRALAEAYQKATQADHEALRALVKQLEAAKKAHRADDVKQLTERLVAVRQRLAAADAELAKQLDAVLTTAQKAWLAGHLHRDGGDDRPHGKGWRKATPTPDARALLPVRVRLVDHLPKSIALTADQRAKVNALVEAYVKAVSADVRALVAIGEQASAARKAGKSDADVKKILEEAAPIRARIEAAAKTLDADVQALLTAEQKAWIASHS